MPKICYERKTFKEPTLDIIAKANAICTAYAAQGLRLSLRQLYYQFVARGWIPNQQKEYKRLGGIIGDARMAGLIDWEWLEDRGRSIEELAHWGSPQEIMTAVGRQYRIDRWADQPKRPFVLVEKAAMEGIFLPVCQRNDVPFFACRGYPSLSALWELGEKLRRYIRDDQVPVVLHFGDHDPSGLDMTRDLADRLGTFARRRVEVRRLALNMNQVEQYNPPPNPAKETDARFASYLEEYGEESWELDALEPTVLATLIEDNILALRDDDAWEESSERERVERERLALAADRWDDVVRMVEED